MPYACYRVFRGLNEDQSTGFKCLRLMDNRNVWLNLA